MDAGMPGAVVRALNSRRQGAAGSRGAGEARLDMKPAEEPARKAEARH